MDHMTKSIHISSSSLHSISNKLTLVNEDRKKTSVLIKNLKNFFNFNIFQFANPLAASYSSQTNFVFSSGSSLLGAATTTTTPTTTGSKNTDNNKIEISIDLTLNLKLNQEKYIHYLNYYYQINYHQNIIYYNNLLLALIILFVLFSLLILLEENETFYNLSAITFLLLITFNLIILIFSHNLTKQFLIHKSYIN